MVKLPKGWKRRKVRINGKVAMVNIPPVKKKYINTCWNKKCLMHGCESKATRCHVCGWKIRKLRDYDNE